MKIDTAPKKTVDFAFGCPRMQDDLSFSSSSSTKQYKRPDLLVALVYSKCLNTTKANHLRPDTPQDEPVYDRPLIQQQVSLCGIYQSLHNNTQLPAQRSDLVLLSQSQNQDIMFALPPPNPNENSDSKAELPPRKKKKKRKGACVTCHDAKVRCQWSSPSQAKCDRCLRLDRECVRHVSLFRITCLRLYQAY